MPDWRLSVHARERMEEMEVPRREVFAALDNPAIVYEQSDRPGTMVALGGRLCVPHNPIDKTVITVAWRSHERTPDRNTPPEERMSGWVNLDAKGAEKVLLDWGFVVAEEKAQAKLWTHPFDPEKRLAPFSNPNRGARANGKSSFRTVAQIVGVPVARFVQGADQDVLERMRQEFTTRELQALEAHRTEPDPLGIGATVRSQRATAAIIAVNTPLVVERVEAPLLGRDGKVITSSTLDAVSTAVSLEPVTQAEVVTLTGISKNTVERALLYLVDEGKVARRLAARDEVPTPGRSPYLYYAGSEVPPRVQPDPAPVEVVVTPEEQPVQPSVVNLVPDTPPVAPPPNTRLYEDTGMPWPDGGVVLRDSEGRLWVAQPLVVGK